MSSNREVFKKSRKQLASERAQARKLELIAGLIETRKRILDAASALSPFEQDQIFLGIWSVKDVLAHLMGWDFTNLDAVKAVRAGRLPDFYAFADRDWKTYNARLVLQYRNDNFAELIAATRASHRELIDALQAIPAEEFEQDQGVRFKGIKVTIARLLQAELEDEKAHYTQISEFRFQQIYAAYQPKILRYMARLVGDIEAEDLTQEVFVKAGQGLAQFRGESKLSTWLYRIATNIALDRLRSPSFQRVAQTSSTDNPIVQVDIADIDVWTGEKKPLIEQQIIRQEMNDCLRDFIGNLPKNYQTVLVLGELEGLSNKEMEHVS
jgi:RNA polymerase sigma-70 factor (ECF subfamily)